MEIHFYESTNCIPYQTALYFGWKETEDAIYELKPIIHTTQMGLMSTVLFEYGYKIFVHSKNGKHYEVKLGENTCTQREIRVGHNIFNLWRAREFQPEGGQNG